MASHARAAARRSSASATPATRPTIVRLARPAAACSPTARFPACYTRTGHVRLTNSKRSGSDELITGQRRDIVESWFHRRPKLMNYLKKFRVAPGTRIRLKDLD